MTSPATRRPTGRFTIHQSGTDQARIHAACPTGRVVHAVRPTAEQLAIRAERKIAAHHTAEAHAAEAHAAEARLAQAAPADHRGTPGGASTVHAAHPTTATPAAAARLAQIARETRAIQAAEALLAAEEAREADRLYARCFGAAAAAHDLPISMPMTGPHADASTMTRAEQDALYASCWPERATAEAPDPLYDALFGKGS